MSIRADDYVGRLSFKKRFATANFFLKIPFKKLTRASFRDKIRMKFAEANNFSKERVRHCELAEEICR